MKKNFRPFKPQPAEADEFKPIRPIRSPVLNWCVKLIPILILAALPVVLWPSNPLNISGREMFSTGLFAAALALFAFEISMNRISTIFGTLWRRGSIANSGNNGGRPASPQKNKDAILAYHHFMKEVEDQLNSRTQWIMAVLFGALVFSWFPFSRTGGRPIYLFGLGAEVVIAFFIGFVVWRMVSTGWHVWRLPKRFEFEVQVLHPDQCGGLEPLGNLCLWNALIIAVAGIFLGGWISIGPTTPFAYYALRYIPLFQVLLIVPIILSLIVFILPLWNTHVVMTRKRDEIQIRLDELAKSIYAESTFLLDETHHLNSMEGEERNKHLNLMRDIYSQHQKIPTWPMNTNIVTKFAVAQALPVLSFAGIGGPIVTVLVNLFKLFAGS